MGVNAFPVCFNALFTGILIATGEAGKNGQKDSSSHCFSFATAGIRLPRNPAARGFFGGITDTGNAEPLGEDAPGRCFSFQTFS